MSQENKKMRFKYVFDDSYNPVFVNGAYGGSSPKGEFVINFYHERIPVPKSLTYYLQEDGTLGDLDHGKPSGYEDTMIRFISTGIVMNYGDAKSIHAWLGQMLQEFEEKNELGQGGQENG